MRSQPGKQPACRHHPTHSPAPLGGTRVAPPSRQLPGVAWQPRQPPGAADGYYLAGAEPAGFLAATTAAGEAAPFLFLSAFGFFASLLLRF